MKQRICLLACAAVLALPIGCGNGSSTTHATGRLALSVVWPKRTRLIPVASNSIRAVVTRGSQTLGSKLIVGTDGPLSNPSIVTFDNLTAGTVTLTATAFPGQDGTGVAQATGAQSVPIVSDQTAQVTVTMASTIDHVAITPANPSIPVGASVSLTMTAFDAAGNIVLAPLTADFVSANTGVVKVAIVGNPSSNQGITAGASLITVTERESGKSASTTVTVTAVVPGPNTGPAQSAVDPTGKFLYVADRVSKTVSQFKINADGTLSPLAPATVSVALPPFSILANPTPGSHTLYVGASDNTNGALYQFNINPDGTLTPLNPASTASTAQPLALNIDPTGKFLFGIDHNDGIRQFIVNADGTLTQNGPDINDGSQRFCASVTPNGKFLYTGNGQGRGLVEYKINPNGTLTSIGSIPSNEVPMGIALDPTGRFLYTAVPVVGVGHISQYLINADGTLTANGVPFPFSLFPFGLRVHPNGQFLYAVATNTPDNVVAQFRINADGTITPLSPATVPAGKFTNSVSISPDGMFLYVTDQNDNAISQFRINADGTITPLSPPMVSG